MSQDLYKLPEGWEWTHFIKCCVLKRGYDLPTRLRNEGAYPLFSANGVTDFIDKFKVKSPGVVTGRSGTIGKVHFVDRDYWPLNTALYVQNFCGNDERFIYYFLKNFNLKRFASGAAVPTLNRNTLSAELVAFPNSRLEQERIVEKLDTLFSRIDAATAHLNQILEHTQALFASALDKMKSTCTDQYSLVPILEVATVARGKSKHRPRNDRKLYGGDYPFIQTGDVRNASKYIMSATSSYNEIGLVQSKLWKQGTICLTIAANIGDVAILGFDACFPDSVVGIYSEKNDNEFLYFYLTTLQRELDRKANSAAQKNINLKILREIQIPLPPLEEQKRIVVHLDGLSERVQALEKTTRERIDHLAALKASLLDTAFRGKL